MKCEYRQKLRVGRMTKESILTRAVENRTDEYTYIKEEHWMRHVTRGRGIGVLTTAR